MTLTKIIATTSMLFALAAMTSCSSSPEQTTCSSSCAKVCCTVANTCPPDCESNCCGK